MIKKILNVGANGSSFLSLAILFAFLCVSNFSKAQYVVDFEAETSGGYASETVTLNGIDWDLTESLIGTLANDFKNGLKSLRLRGYGTSSFTMLQDKPNGIGTISFLYSEYGTDAQTSWRVEYSTDAGANWTQVGTDITATGGNASPSTFSETMNVLGNARIRVVEVTGAGTSNRRMNIDDITITDYVAVTPTITATPTLLTGFTQFLGTPSAEQTFEVTGTLLTDDITLTVTSGDYEISETSGAGFGTSITLTQTAGEVAATTIYVRLNGLLAASPSNGVVTLTSTGATDVLVNLEGEILNAVPTVFVSETALSGFSHFVGTQSAEQTFEVSGSFLTDDIVITAPANYEVSETSGAGFGPTVTLAQTAGEVAPTTIYVRLNGATANPSQVGDITVASTGVANQTIALSGETLEYTLTTIGAVTAIDANGVGTSEGDLVELRGIVHCIDFRGGNGYNVTVIDGAGDGIQLFNFNQVSGYESAEGDSLQIFGTVAQFNGLLQINADNIIVVSQGNATVTPNVVTALDESTESQLVALENLTFVTPAANWPANGNVDVTDGTTVFTVRVVNASPLSGAAAPVGPFNITGVGGQFDNSSPFDAGYQIFPCSVEELCNVDVTTTTTDFTIEATATGLTYQWVDCDDNFAPISGETNQSFTATANGNYAVIVTDGACSDTSDCVAISTIGVDIVNSLLVSTYPNPVNDMLTIEATEQRFNVTIFNLEGKVLSTHFNVDEKLEVNTSAWSKGIYTVLVSNETTTHAIKIVK
ncbi:MAG: T9SS type A sorting domain-containing protein [Crocinitomicaceae bacterium]|nr:T9SS type A sorting domain-containing protein [Crocinitomicaceae bacterium]